MRLNQGFVDRCSVAEAILLSQLLDMTAPGKVCISEYHLEMLMLTRGLRDYH